MPPPKLRPARIESVGTSLHNGNVFWLLTGEHTACHLRSQQVLLFDVVVDPADSTVAQTFHLRYTAIGWQMLCDTCQYVPGSDRRPNSFLLNKPKQHHGLRRKRGNSFKELIRWQPNQVNLFHVVVIAEKIAMDRRQPVPVERRVSGNDRAGVGSRMKTECEIDGGLKIHRVCHARPSRPQFLPGKPSTLNSKENDWHAGKQLITMF